MYLKAPGPVNNPRPVNIKPCRLSKATWSCLALLLHHSLRPDPSMTVTPSTGFYDSCTYKFHSDKINPHLYGMLPHHDLGLCRYRFVTPTECYYGSDCDLRHL